MSSAPRLTRRTLLQRAGLGGLGAALVPRVGAADTASKSLSPAAPRTTAPTLAPLHRFGRMMQEYFVARVRHIEREAEARRAALHTRADAEAYVRDAREKAARCFGPLPPKTPLNARVTRAVERDAYRIENVIFESRPGFPVTANLYLPKNLPGPLPAVVGTCGHMDNGKAGEPYQSFAQALARQGFICLIFDPIGQGERVQCLGPDLRPRHGIGVPEHLQTGNPQFLVGEFLGTWMAWDGIRALDYLLTRPEVDPRHLGITGNSGGGTQTTWLCALDPRWTMAAPSCFVTTFRRNLENEEAADTEQCPPRALALGLDHADFIAALAPRPVLLLSQEKDFFDTRGTEEAFARLQKLYRLLGAERNLKLFVGPDPHGYTQPNRESMYGWFNRHAKARDAATEPPLQLEKDETLWCTPRGQVGADASPSRTIVSFTREAAIALEAVRPRLDGPELSRAVARALKVDAALGDATAPAPDYRILRPGNRRYPKAHAATYAVETEPGIHALVYRLSDTPLLSRVPRGQERAILYVAHHSADAELRSEPLIAELLSAEPQSAFFACDVRGSGESQPNTTARAFLDPYGSDYFYAIHSLMLDQPYVGRKTHDLLRLLSWLHGTGHREIHLVGCGWGALPAVFAAVLSEQVSQVTLKHALASYDAVARAETYRWPLSCLVPDVLRAFDLPDCYRELARKQLRQIEPCGAMGVP